MLIAGIEKCSFVDYPGHLAAVVFTAGCNWNCFYCHNRDIAYRQKVKVTLEQHSVLNWLAGRRDKLEGVVISGGEPTLQRGLLDFIRQVRDLGFLVKLDTNGSHPETLRKLLEQHLLDYVAMDIKAPLPKYSQFCDAPVDHGAINESIDILLLGDIDYEFRTTFAPQLTARDICDIAERIRGAKKYVLQQYRVVEDEIDDPRIHMPPHSADTVFQIIDLLRGIVRQVDTRGFDSARNVQVA